MNSKQTATYGKKTEITWEIEFKKGSNQIERIKALSEVEKYILDFLHHENSTKNLKFINFSTIPNLEDNRPVIGLNVGFSFVSTGATVSPTVPPNPPKRIFFSQISPVIKNISVLKGENK